MSIPDPADFQVRSHVLACRNLMIGSCNLIIIGLPEGWHVRQGPFPAEVDRWVVEGEYSWATSGRGSFHFLAPARDGGRRLTFEARLHVEPAGSRAARPLVDPAAALSQVEEAGTAHLCGHPARWALGAVRRGLRRRPVPALAVTLACSVTRRQIRLTVEGEDREALTRCRQAILHALACH